MLIVIVVIVRVLIVIVVIVIVVIVCARLICIDCCRFHKHCLVDNSPQSSSVSYKIGIRYLCMQNYTVNV